MPKELFIASSPHETKVAVFEDDNLVEVFYQRDTDVGLVGGIYKGRVSRVLPGMQSAFVDIGLERDAFLYVSDFFEDSDEYDRVVADAETRVGKLTATESQAVEGTQPAEQPGVEIPPSPASAQADIHATEEASAEDLVPAAASPEETAPAPVPPAASSNAAEGRDQQPQNRAWQDSPGGRGRRRRRGRGRFGKQPFRDREPDRRPSPPSSVAPSTGFEILPGESLAKYGQGNTENVSSSVSAAESVNSAAENQTEDEASESAFSTQSDVFPADKGVKKEVSASAEAFDPASAESPAAQESLTSMPLVAEGLETDLLAGNFRLSPLPVEPDAPSRAFASKAKGREAPATGIPEDSESGNTLVDAEEPESAAIQGADDLEEASAGLDEPAALEDLSADAKETGEPAERSYTMRDQHQHQRPRFAPRRGRRGRGRFGNRGPRPEGRGRRPDFPRAGNEQPVQINEVLKEGQEILVQIAKEPLGTKGARITSHIALPGRYLVFMPTIHHIGVSRKIGTEEERLRLRNIILEHRGSLTGGIIVRTAAAGRSEEELKADLEFLGRLWHEIRERTERSKAPVLIHRDLTLVERILRDILSPDFKSVRVDNELEYQSVLDFVHRFQPSLVGHVKLYTKDEPLFEEFGIQSEIDKALKPKVWLKSGGYIVINQTEALVAIDVNTGKYVGKTNRLEDTIVKTNIDAVKEIVRQIRLRDLGGIVVIDFIDMDDRRNRAKVVQALEEALRKDRAPTKILSFNEFGLVALTRKRVKQSLERTLSEQCPYCTGSGWIKSVTTVCYEIMEEAKKMAGEIEGNTLTLRVNPEVARALKSREGVLTTELESLTGKDVVIKSDPTVHQERFEIF